MRDRLHYEVKRMGEVECRMKELAASYNEFLDLREQKAQRKPRIERLLALAGPWDWDSANFDYHENEAMRITGVYANTAQDAAELLAKLPLWEAMVEFLSFVPEARIGEMERFFQDIDFPEGNRQAIESALKRHPSLFKTRKKKREKYISLKGVPDAASTKAGRK